MCIRDSFEAMGQRALGAPWTTLTPAQRSQFVAAFSQVVRNQSLADLSIYRARVGYGDVSVNGNAATARTTAGLQNRTVRVDYQLAFSGGAWRITDIVLDGVSTADGYARSFGQVVRQRGFPALLTALQRRAASGR